MKIEALMIKNFRQFLGEVSIEFSTDEVRNVTVIHGANGAGKTSLLNAFKWCFYEETDFDTHNDHILNEAAIHKSDENALIDLLVEVKFTHQGERFRASRVQEYKKQTSLTANVTGKSRFELFITDSTG